MRGRFGVVAAAAASIALLTGASIAAAQPAPPPAAEAPIDADQLALARRLMSLLTNQMNFGAVMKTMTTSMMQAVRKQNPNVDPAVFDRVQAATDKAMADMMPDLMDDVAKSYARHLTRKEMEDSIAFYESPSGQSMMHKLPEIAGDLGPMMAKYIPRMQRSVLDSLCAQNACTAEQRKALGEQTP